MTSCRMSVKFYGTGMQHYEDILIFIFATNHSLQCTRLFVLVSRMSWKKICFLETFVKNKPNVLPVKSTQSHGFDPYLASILTQVVTPIKCVNYGTVWTMKNWVTKHFHGEKHHGINIWGNTMATPLKNPLTIFHPQGFLFKYTKIKIWKIKCHREVC